MHIPVLGFIGTAARVLWNKLRSRPTGQADRGALAAGGDQSINAPVATGSSVVATDQGAVVTTPHGSLTIILQSGATANFAFYVDDLPSSPVLARNHFQEGRRLQQAERHDAAIAEFQTALADADTEGQRGALHLLIGVSESMRSRSSQAERSLQEAGKLFQSVRDKQGEAAALFNLGLIYLKATKFKQAEECLTQTLAIRREVGDRLGEADALHFLGLVYLLWPLTKAEKQDQRTLDTDGQPEKAEEHFKQALDIYRQINNRPGEAGALGSLGMVYLQSRDLGKAKEYMNQGLAIAEEIGASGDKWEIVRRVLEALERQQQDRGE